MSTAEPRLARRFGLLTSIALIVGQVIAVGIFLTPAGMAKSVGSPFWLLAIWLLMGVMTLSGALCYAELASRFPEAGGSYVYLREAYGRPMSFLYGWMTLLVLDPGLTALLATGLAEYASFLVPLTSFGKAGLAIGTILVLGTVNILGARIGANFLMAMTAIKIATLLVIIVYGFAGGAGDWNHFVPFFSQPAEPIGAFAGGIAGAFFAFAGWWEATRVAGEVEDPQRNVPRALVIGVLIITAVYVLTSAAFTYLVHPAEVVNDQAFAAKAGEVMFGPVGGAVLAAIVVISVAGSITAYLMVSPRVYYAMARDGLFFSPFGRPHRRFGTPHLAIMIQMALASLLVLAGNFEQILSYFFFIVVLFVALSVAGLFRLRRRDHDGYRTPLFPATPVFFLAITAVVLLLIAARNPVQTGLGLGVTLLGLPVYYLLFVRGKKDGMDQNHPVQ
jgi:basic amino acid/polyamine antiporter, APA family